MHNVMVYDLETSSLNTEPGPDGATIQEIAYAIFHVDEILGWQFVEAHSMLIDWRGLFDYTPEPEAERITGLSKNFCETHGVPAPLALSAFLSHLEGMDYLAGQNAILYDRPVLINNLDRLMAGALPSDIFKKFPHLDSLFDLPLPKEIKPKSLKYFALDHNYVHANAHRALSDVQACAHIFSRYPFKSVCEIADSPLVELHARCEYGDQKTKNKLYEQGFRWDPEHKIYKKKTREFFKSSHVECHTHKILYDAKMESFPGLSQMDLV